MTKITPGLRLPSLDGVEHTLLYDPLPSYCEPATRVEVAVGRFKDVIRGNGTKVLYTADPQAYGQVFIVDVPDVAYEDWHGHKLDRKLLDLLKQKSAGEG